MATSHDAQSTAPHRAGLPLSGQLVFDFTRHLSGPFATMLLHDLGAEVIKFESRTGDPARRAGPFAGSDSAYFQPINRGKRSVVVDLTSPSDVAAILRLVPFADCLAENFRPGVLAGAGLGSEAVRAVNPGLIYASCTGFGATGPLSDRPAFDVVVQAMGGIMSVTGTEQSGPTRVGISQADIVGGIFMALAICAALTRRERTGQGAVVDLSMYESQLMLLTHALGIASATGSPPGRIGNRHPAVAPFDVYPAKDGDVAIAAADDRSFAALCQALEARELAGDERFASNELRLANVATLTEVISALTRPLTKAELIERLSRAQVPSGAVATLTEVLADPHLAARQALAHVLPFGDRPQGLQVPALPFLLDGRRLADPRRAPELGEMTLAELESRLAGAGGQTSRQPARGSEAAQGPADGTAQGAAQGADDGSATND